MLTNVIASIAVKTQLETPVFLQHNRMTQDEFGMIPGKGTFVCRINKLPIVPSSYQVNYALIKDGTCLDGLNNSLELSVVEGDFYQSGEVSPISHGICLVDAQWRLESKV